MNQETQKIILRATLVFALVFGLVFGVVSRLGAGDTSRYEAKTTLVLLPRNKMSIDALPKTDAVMATFFDSEMFRQKVADARYASTEEWEKFSLSVEHPVTGVFVFVYRDESIDPYSAQEAMETVREEALLAVTRKYDALRDIEVRFLDAGTVVETTAGTPRHNLTLELLVAALTAGAFELIAFGIGRITSGRVLQKAVREKVQESSTVRPWWLTQSATERSAQRSPVFEEVEAVYAPAQAQEPERKTEETKISSEEKEEAVTEDVELPAVAASVLEAHREVPRTFPSAGAPPANLSVLADIPDILKPTWQGNSSVKEEEEEMIDPTEEDSALFEAPVKNPEPSAEELKARLNRLLRGEMG